MRLYRSIWWVIRTSILLIALFGALLLYQWSREGNPKFYIFAESQTGQLFARTFHWNTSPLEIPVFEKKVEDWTAQDLAMRKKLEAELLQDFPTHRIVTDNGQIILGRILTNKSDSIVYSETYGQSGNLSMTMRKNRIVSMEALTNSVPDVTYRDVQFKLENPSLNFYKRPPYTIMTDESFFRVESAVRILQQLYIQFVPLFQAVIEKAERAPNIHVLFFSNEREYRKYQEQYAPQMTNSSGFYSPKIDRLIIYNQGTSDRIRELQAQVDKRFEDYRRQYPFPQILAQIDAQKKQADRNIAQFAEAQTQAALRHEGAHQLFFRLGVHSRYQLENDWLIEGLAAYCETPDIGIADPMRISMLKSAITSNSLFSLTALLKLRGKAGFLSIESPERIELAYNQSWALVHMLMQKDLRPAFFDYMRFIRDPAHFSTIQEENPLDLLCRHLNLSATELDRRYSQYLRTL